MLAFVLGGMMLGAVSLLAPRPVQWDLIGPLSMKGMGDAKTLYQRLGVYDVIGAVIDDLFEAMKTTSSSPGSQRGGALPPARAALSLR
jgi:hypothetical protein